MKQRTVITIVFLLMCGGVAYFAVYPTEGTPTTEPSETTRSAWDKLNDSLTGTEKALVELNPLTVGDAAAVSHRYSADSLVKNPLLIRTSDGTLVQITADGGAPVISDCRAVLRSCELFFDDTKTVLLLDGDPLPLDLAACSMYRICDQSAALSESTPTTIPARTVKDGFMRPKLFDHAWKRERGR